MCAYEGLWGILILRTGKKKFYVPSFLLQQWSWIQAKTHLDQGSFFHLHLFCTGLFVGLCFAFLFLPGSWQSSVWKARSTNADGRRRKSKWKHIFNTVLKRRKKKRAAQWKFNSCELCAQRLRGFFFFVICRKKLNYALDYSVRLYDFFWYWLMKHDKVCKLTHDWFPVLTFTSKLRIMSWGRL